LLEGRAQGHFLLVDGHLEVLELVLGLVQGFFLPGHAAMLHLEGARRLVDLGLQVLGETPQAMDFAQDHGWGSHCSSPSKVASSQ
jgi:hypothetical protein